MLMLRVSNGVEQSDERDGDFLTLFADGRCDGVPATLLTEFCNCSKSNNILSRCVSQRKLKLLFSKGLKKLYRVTKGISILLSFGDLQ
ncbi:hypothetical protein RHGRI_006835 [Rhododendron griersonianum]|uniref:Uncharacterized protein n=1 Tax=Rhododendron griersonianum TaxID=479676 RepID=A0AAV6KV32_9ERIC|nr:hypothetical protein RHGRI_006835 [Rhododendron griersonianum]